MLKGILAVTLLIAIIVALPILLVTSDHIEVSYFGSCLLDAAAAASSLTARIFGEIFKHALAFLTIETVGGRLC